jgi:hypothetical protein
MAIYPEQAAGAPALGLSISEDKVFLSAIYNLAQGQLCHGKPADAYHNAMRAFNIARRIVADDPEAYGRMMRQSGFLAIEASRQPVVGANESIRQAISNELAADWQYNYIEIVPVPHAHPA